MRTISIDLTDDQAALFDHVAATGEYATPKDAILEAMEEWQAQRQAQLLSEDTELLRQLWNEGHASGKTKPVDFAETLNEARRRTAAVTSNAA